MHIGTFMGLIMRSELFWYTRRSKLINKLLNVKLLIQKVKQVKQKDQPKYNIIERYTSFQHFFLLNIFLVWWKLARTLGKNRMYLFVLIEFFATFHISLYIILHCIIKNLVWRYTKTKLVLNDLERVIFWFSVHAVKLSELCLKKFSEV